MQFIYPTKDGGLAFHCQSTGCTEKSVHDAIKLLAERNGVYLKGIWANDKQPRKLFMSTSNLDEVAEPVVVWTVQDVLMAGVLNLFVGDPDIGKSFMACHYIAQLTREGKRVIIICREDHESVWKKRVRAAKGILSQSLVTFVNGVRDEYDPTYKEEWMLDNATHVEFLHQCMKASEVALVVLDSLADLAANTDLNAARA